MTQEELAAQLGVTPTAVSKWENNNTLPDILMLCALADYFGITTDHLLGRDKGTLYAYVAAPSEELVTKTAALAKEYGIETLCRFDDFAEAFGKTDVLILAEIYAAREKNIYRISSAQLAEKIRQACPGKEVLFMPDFKDIAAFVTQHARPGDMVITMGAGDIYKVGEMILEA